jgi:hypothetical protein
MGRWGPYHLGGENNNKTQPGHSGNIHTALYIQARGISKAAGKDAACPHHPWCPAATHHDTGFSLPLEALLYSLQWKYICGRDVYAADTGSREKPAFV